jgi:hypothetical protein
VIDPLGQAVAGGGTNPPKLTVNPTSDPTEIDRRKKGFLPMIQELGNFFSTPQGQVSALVMARELQANRSPFENNSFGARVTDAALAGAEFTGNFNKNLREFESSDRAEGREQERIGLTRESQAETARSNEAEVASREGIEEEKAKVAREKIKALTDQNLKDFNLQQADLNRKILDDANANYLSVAELSQLEGKQPPAYRKFVMDYYNSQAAGNEGLEPILPEAPNPVTISAAVQQARLFAQDGQDVEAGIRFIAEQRGIDPDALVAEVMKVMSVEQEDAAKQKSEGLEQLIERLRREKAEKEASAAALLSLAASPQPRPL